MKSRTRRICSVAMLAMLACAMAPALRAETPACPAGTDLLAEYRLFFGRSQGTVEVVTDEAWQAFLAAEITPRFPDGLTVVDAAGQWRDATGTIVRERSKLVIILAEPGAVGDAAYRGDCPRIQAHLRPGSRSACDRDRLRIVLAVISRRFAKRGRAGAARPVDSHFSSRDNDDAAAPRAALPGGTLRVRPADSGRPRSRRHRQPLVPRRRGREGRNDRRDWPQGQSDPNHRHSRTFRRRTGTLASLPIE